MMNLMNITMDLMNSTCNAKLSVILGEDVNSPELRNPKLSGMSKTRGGLFQHLFKGLKANK